MAGAAIALTAVLVFVARPLAVFLSTPFLGFALREKLFVSWAGLRGAVPIVLATFALSSGVQKSDTIFNAVFFVVLLSALAQGLTLGPLGRRLGADIVEHVIQRGALLEGLKVRDSGLPRDALVMLIVRDGVGVPPRGSTVLEAGDALNVLASEGSRERVESLLEEWKAPGGPGG